MDIQILSLPVVFLIIWYLIIIMSGLTTMHGEVFPGDGKITLLLMLFYMLIFYFPLLKFLNSLSLISTLNPRLNKLIILTFYLFIIVTSLPILEEQSSGYIGSKNAEGKQFIGSMNRAQQSYFEENKTFAPTVDALGLGIKTETDNFQYSLMSTNQAAFHYAVSKNKKLKSYVGGVFVMPLQEEVNTLSILCRTNKPSTIKPLPPTLENGQLTCAAETTEVEVIDY